MTSPLRSFALFLATLAACSLALMLWPHAPVPAPRTEPATDWVDDEPESEPVIHPEAQFDGGAEYACGH